MARFSKAQAYLLGRFSRLRARRVRAFCWRGAANIGLHRNCARLFLLRNSWLLDACVVDFGLASAAVYLPAMPQMVFRDLVVQQPVCQKVRTLWPAQMGKFRFASADTAIVKPRASRRTSNSQAQLYTNWAVGSCPACFPDKIGIGPFKPTGKYMHCHRNSAVV
jgi:hypothetical protein